MLNTDKKIHIVGFSGGIDSQACAIWVKNHFPNDTIVLLNSNAGGNESPITEKFIEEYSKKISHVVPCNAIYSDLWKTEQFAEKRGFDGNETLSFIDMIKIKGRAPSRKAQFCTGVLKIAPQLRWIKDNINSEYERYTGVRRDESDVRKNTPFREFDDHFDCYVNHPLADWSKKMCFEYVTAHRQDYNPLYKLGFGRVGCAPCINSGKDDILLWQSRYPDMIEKVRNFEKISGTTFFAPMVPGLTINTIDQVLEWCFTGRGGRQKDFIRIMEVRPSCESKYGLCE